MEIFLFKTIGEDAGESLGLPDDQHIRVHLISQAFLTIGLEIESDSAYTIKQADYAENHHFPLAFHHFLSVYNLV